MEKIPKYLSIGWRIRGIRSEKGLKQTQFAKALGLSQSVYSSLENGLTKPSMPILLAMEYVFSVRKEWILTGDGPMYRELEGLGTPISITPVDTDSDRHRKMWINKLNRIFDEGDKTKIDAIKAQLRAFDPGVKKQGGVNEENGEAGTENCRVA